MPMHPLYKAAEDADESLNAAIKRVAGDYTRWTLPARFWESATIRMAYQVKREADEAWLAFMRADSEARSARNR
jgi:hypothetical protein